jgi:hypothetical protein
MGSRGIAPSFLISVPDGGDGHLQATTTLSPGREMPPLKVPTGQEAGWVSELVKTLFIKETYVTPIGNLTC